MNNKIKQTQRSKELQRLSNVLDKAITYFQDIAFRKDKQLLARKQTIALNDVYFFVVETLKEELEFPFDTMGKIDIDKLVFGKEKKE